MGQNRPMVDKKKYAMRLKNLYESKMGEVLSDEEALEILEKLVALVETVYE